MCVPMRFPLDASKYTIPIKRRRRPGIFDLQDSSDARKARHGIKMAMHLRSTVGEANELSGKDERSSREMCALPHTGQVRLPRAKSVR